MEIMIIDDDDDDLHLYSELFESIDDDVHTMVFNDPANALCHLRNSALLPDLIILDFNMPRMNGLQFLILLRADPALSQLRVAVLTTSCSGRDRENFVALDAPCHEKLSSFQGFKDLLQRILIPS
jgi:CheY-like chemotaxis protein